MPDTPVKKSELSWMPDLGGANGPKYLAIAEALRADIRAGRLAAGHRLPPQRLLASELGIDLTTVTRAFNEARRLGLIDASSGRGSFVRAAPPREAAEPDAAPVVDLSMNMPPQPPEARLAERLQEAVGQILGARSGLQYLHYQESTGSGPDRAAGAQWLEGRLGPLAPERILVAGGAQGALYALIRVLLRPGEGLAVPALAYPGLRAVADRLGVRLLPVPMDGDGLDPDALDAIGRREAPRALYCVPTIDNPTTATMPPGRREAVVTVARRHGMAIIEDDAYGALPRRPPVPLASLAPEITWHVATLSKCATPALRTAYVVAPRPAGLLQLAAEIRATALMVSPLMTAVASRWIRDGSLDAITAAIRDESAARQAVAARALRGLDVRAHPDGHHLWLALPERWRGADLALQARRSGLALVPSAAFAVDGVPDAVRISLGAAPTRPALERGLDALAVVLSHEPSTLSLVV